MAFNSIQFLVFFVVVITAFFALRRLAHRHMLLLAASIYFYMCWRPEYVLLLIFSSLIDYWAAIKMGQRPDIRDRRPFLIISLISNLGLLFFFKYFSFVNENLRDLVEPWAGYPVPMIDVLLPVGISFYTFQTMSYSIDVYWGHAKPERNINIYMLFVSYFPQLVAGPIERAPNLIAQFKLKAVFDRPRVISGLKLMAWGMFKKVMIADRVAPMVDHVYNSVGAHEGPAYLLATLLFAIQIYCDFSGYSDIAIGAARVMDVDLMRNFRSPYFSRSISEFWRRWHISLSTWFRDYVYIPLGGNRTIRWRWYFNLFITFFLSGIWHGANWTFVIWGALHGFYLIFATITTGRKQRINSILKLDRSPVLLGAIQMITTFVLVCIGWVFFRANNIQDAFTIFREMGTDASVLFGAEASRLYAGLLGSMYSEMVLAIGAIGVLILVDALQNLPGGVNGILARRPAWQRWAVYYCFIGSMIFFGAYYRTVDFIYFQF